ncbi:GtrA family protein [Dyella sp. A6]|uniref:GtrA family protein n=1 Tax=Dyella aluminiiresistens TaxID=3069105 RepID=UPI002E77E8DB|nr:GtrA family protein [Dyella sp. A6]
MKMRREIALFAVGGAIGFVVDASILQLLVWLFDANPYIAQIFAFLVAATATWWWNRSRTFAARASGRSLLGEWMHWMVLMGAGAAVNYAAYAGSLLLFPAWHRWPVLAVAVGSVVAAMVNYTSARIILFKKTKMAS